MTDSSHITPGDCQVVLIADADSSNATHVERQLRRAGVKQPVVAFNHGDALHTFLTTAAQKEDAIPCVLFLDPTMPGANGFDPVRWMRREEKLKNAEIVIFASSDDPDITESAGELKLTLFIKKHPDLASLAPIIAYLAGTQNDEGLPLGEPATAPSK